MNISFSLESEITNGIQVAALVSHSVEISGISIASIRHNAEKINGFAASYGIVSDTLNGMVVL